MTIFLVLLRREYLKEGDVVAFDEDFVFVDLRHGLDANLPRAVDGMFRQHIFQRDDT